MTVSQLLTALTNVTRVDLVIGDVTYRVESNEVGIINDETLALTIETIELKTDGRIPYIVATTAE